jgi:ATP-binding cassette subfamily F protein uup
MAGGNVVYFAASRRLAQAHAPPRVVARTRITPLPLISLQNVSLRFGGAPLLDAVSLNIEQGECACLVGRNGSGKSSLLRLLAGEIEPDQGQVVRQAGLRVAYLPQEVPAALSGSVRQVVEAGMRRHHEAESWEHAAAAEQAMSRLGVAADAPFETLSGGLKRRALLARALVCEPDLLLLDEPTNHLDIAAIEWMEEFLKRRVTTLLFVTHDRLFLRHLARRILDLDRGALAGWDCDYDTFLLRKQQMVDDEAVAWQRQDKLLDKEEAWLRQGVRARRTRNEGRVRALERLRAEYGQRRFQAGASRIALQAAERSGALALKVENLSFAYPGGAPVIANLDLRILRGERIGIVGPNGSGKTTLLRLLCGALAPTGGRLTAGTNLRSVYFDQLRATLEDDKSVAENVAGERDTVTVNGTARHIHAYLRDFLFTPERARTPVKALSGGERNRLLLARNFLEPSNLLAMDEPTNDLDIETLDLLEEQLAGYPGTLLLVSHDRAFLNNVATSTLSLEGEGRVVQYAGGYDDWLRQRPQPAAPRARKTSPSPVPSATARRKRLGFKEQRELAGIVEHIAALEAEMKLLHEQLGDPAFYRRAPAEIDALQARAAALPAEIEQLVERWGELEALNKG